MRPLDPCNAGGRYGIISSHKRRVQPQRSHFFAHDGVLSTHKRHIETLQVNPLSVALGPW